MQADDTFKPERGDETPDPPFEPSGSIAGQLMQKFFQWMGTVWVNRNEVPDSAEDLARFDMASLIPEYHAYVAGGGEIDLEHGMRMEECWLMGQLTAREPLVCMVNSLQPPQPGERITRLQVMEGAQILSLLKRLFAPQQGTAEKTDGMFSAGVYDGADITHQITLRGVDESGNILYWDPWPGRSLLCAENNSAGVAAQAVPDSDRLWVLSPEEMETVILYALVPLKDMEAVAIDSELTRMESADFFQWFHLERVGMAREGAVRGVTYRPSGELFRNAVLVTITIAPGRGITAARLILHRGFIDSPRDGVFAADIARSFAIFLGGLDASGDAAARALAEQIDGNDVYRGAGQQNEQAIGHGKLTTHNRGEAQERLLEMLWIGIG